MHGDHEWWLLLAKGCGKARSNMQVRPLSIVFFTALPLLGQPRGSVEVKGAGVEAAAAGTRPPTLPPTLAAAGGALEEVARADFTMPVQV